MLLRHVGVVLNILSHEVEVIVDLSRSVDVVRQTSVALAHRDWPIQLEGSIGFWHVVVVVVCLSVGVGVSLARGKGSTTKVTGEQGALRIDIVAVASRIVAAIVMLVRLKRGE